MLTNSENNFITSNRNYPESHLYLQKPKLLTNGEVASVSVGQEWCASADCAPTAPFEEKSTALLNSLWGREKIKFEHLGKTKDLAATPTETKDGNIAFLKPNRKPGPPSWPAPRGGSIDLSQLIQLFPPDSSCRWPARPSARPRCAPALPQVQIRSSWLSHSREMRDTK